MRRIIFLYLTVSLMLLSCGEGSMQSSQESGDTVTFKYAELIKAVKYPGYTVVNLMDPWHKGNLLHTYILVPRDADDVPVLPKGTVIYTPMLRAVPFSTVHVSLLMNLGKKNSIAGVADLKYIKIPYIQQQCLAGKIADVGSSMSPSVEKIMDISPDGLLVSPFENSGGYGKLDETGIPVVECSDYMETSALGRAEWIRFYGMLFGAEHEADSIFSLVDSTYNALRAIAGKSAVRHSLLMDKKTGSVWYVPGGRSTLGVMMADANAVYAFSDDTSNGSLSLPFETVLDKARESDIWMFRYSGKDIVTYDRLLSEYHGYSQIKAFRERRCYGCNVELSRFYEEVPFRPDYLLRDFIQIVHPEIDGLGGLRYYHRVEGR